MKRSPLIVTGLAITVLLAVSTSAMAESKSAVNSKAETTKEIQFIKDYSDSIKPDNDSHQGKLYRAGKINVLVLEGTYEEMGRQYGALLADELKANHNGIVEGLKNIKDVTYDDLQEEGDMTFSTYPEKYRKIVEGLAETSGLGMEKAKVLLAQETYVYVQLLALAKEQNISGSAKCSGVAAWNDYTPDGKMIFGRNYDLGPANHEYVTLVIYNPVDGSIPSSSLTFAGSIYTTSGMNRDGLFLELNNGSTSDPSDYSGKRISAPLVLFQFLEQAPDNDLLSVFFNSSLPDMSYIINTADKSSAYSFEWSTSKVVRRGPDRPGLLAATNIFFDPSWGKQTYDAESDPDAIVKRRDNLLALAEKSKGRITAEVMQKIMATPLEDGGSFRAPNFTSYEVVASPSDLTMWLRVPEYQDWVEVNLGQFFK